MKQRLCAMRPVVAKDAAANKPDLVSALPRFPVMLSVLERVTCRSGLGSPVGRTIREDFLQEGTFTEAES